LLVLRVHHEILHLLVLLRQAVSRRASLPPAARSPAPEPEAPQASEPAAQPGGQDEPPEPWDDALADSVALVCAELAEDLAGAGAILRNGSHRHMVVALAKLLSEVVTEQDVSPAHFRTWARQAVDRP
jgi:hypothetical protein